MTAAATTATIMPSRSQKLISPGSSLTTEGFGVSVGTAVGTGESSGFVAVGMGLLVGFGAAGR